MATPARVEGGAAGGDAAGDEASDAAGAPGAPPRHQHAPGAPRERNRPRARRGDSTRRLVHAAVWVLAFVPLARLVFRLVTDDLGGEPIDAFEKQTGYWTLRFLAASLAVTPLRMLTGWSWLAPYRRTLGLVTFAWATVHLLAYAVLDMVGNVPDIVADVVKHPYVTLGMLSWLLLLPLAITSTKGMTRRLGGVRWRRLHQLAYVVALTATVHFMWSVKKDRTRPAVFAGIFGTLLVARPLLERRRATRGA